MKTYTYSELTKIIKKHKEWLDNGSKGQRANLSSADLSSADLSFADLSKTKSLLISAQWLLKNCKQDDRGIICYKRFGDETPHDQEWKIRKGAILEEVCNMQPADAGVRTITNHVCCGNAA